MRARRCRISPGSEVSLAAGANEITVTVTAEDGTTVQVYTVTVTRAGSPAATIAAVSSSVTEGTAAAFTVTLREAAATGAERGGERHRDRLDAGRERYHRPVTVPKGATSATLSVPTAGDAVVEADSTVTATLSAGAGYTVGAASSASVTVTEDDEGAFSVSVAPQTIKEGESATLAVEISNGVTFAEDQTIALAVSGTASAADYSLSPTPLTLVAGSSSVTAAVTATRDAEEEANETLTVTASRGEVSLGSATVTIESVSHDATLSSLSLSGIDIGTFSAETTAYAASVAPSVQTTTVTATASHADASVAIVPGPELSLAEGGNTVTVTVTAEDGATTQTYTVNVRRASLPVVSIAAVAGRVSEGERAEFRVSLSEPATERLRVGIRWTRSDQSESLTQYTQFHVGMSSKTPSFSKSDDKVVREDLAVSITLEDGEGYRVSEDARWAQVVLEENDEAEFAVSVRPASVAEGESASVRVRTTNGVTFAESQTIALGFAGSTATKGADYTVSAESLTLRAGSRRVTASLAAIEDSDHEDDETVRVEAAHRGEVIGTATLTITGTEPGPAGIGRGFLAGAGEQAARAAFGRTGRRPGWRTWPTRGCTPTGARTGRGSRTRTLRRPRRRWAFGRTDRQSGWRGSGAACGRTGWPTGRGCPAWTWRWRRTRRRAGCGRTARRCGWRSGWATPCMPTGWRAGGGSRAARSSSRAET